MKKDGEEEKKREGERGSGERKRREVSDNVIKRVDVVEREQKKND